MPHDQDVLDRASSQINWLACRLDLHLRSIPLFLFPWDFSPSHIQLLPALTCRF